MVGNPADVTVSMKTLEDRVKALLPEYRQELERFIVDLERRRHVLPTGPTFSWAGALKGTNPDRTSVDLQHEVLEQRSRTS